MDFYAMGQDEALRKYGARRKRVEEEEEEEEKDKAEDSSGLGRKALRMAPVSVGAALPWVGSTMKEPVRHLEQGVSVDSYEEALKNLKAGDVVLVGGTTPKERTIKGLISSVTGTPQVEHAAVVVDDHGTVIHSHPGGGITRRHISEITKPTDRLHVMRHKNMSPETRATWLGNLQQAADRVNEYGHVVGRAAGPLGHEDYWRLHRDAGSSLYDFSAGARAGLRDVLLPQRASAEAIEDDRFKRQRALFNLGSTEDVKELEGRGEKLREYLTPDTKETRELGPIEKLWNRVTRSTEDRYPKDRDLSVIKQQKARGLDDPSSRPNRVLRTRGACDAAGFCTSLPAVTLPAGEVIVPGKLPSRILPSDYLRSPVLKPVAYFDSRRGSKLLEDRLMRHGPNVLRSIASLGLGSLGAAAGRLF